MFLSALPVRFVSNPGADHLRPYGPSERSVLSLSAHEAAFREISSWPEYAPTPLHSLRGLARELGVGALWYKDEGSRMGAGSFKALGGIYGVFRVAQAVLERETGQAGVGSDRFGSPPFPAVLAGLTVACASAGNHGRAVARGAEMFGCRSVVFLPAGASPHRVRAIRKHGARTLLVNGAYDDAVSVAARRSEEENWSVVADTSYPGYEEVPRHIMQGYTVLAREALEQLGGASVPTHVFLQGGVGGMAGAVTGHLWESLGRQRPRIAVVEPVEADCLLESAIRNAPSPSSGNLETSMECLACRSASPEAWKLLGPGADVFLSIHDKAAEDAVEALEAGMGGDTPILTQPSGAAGVAGLIAAILEPSLRDLLSLGSDSSVLVIGSEGPS